MFKNTIIENATGNNLIMKLVIILVKIKSNKSDMINYIKQ